MVLKYNQNIGWIDMLRVVACLFVVFAHSCDAFVAHFDANREMFLTGVMCGSLLRPCVPLFAMITAVLLLPVKPATSLSQFYKKRIGRVIVPIVFWSIALPLMAYCYFTVINPATLNPQLSVGDYTAATLLQRLYTFVFNFNFDTTPLWYLYMLIGLYLIMSVISSWLSQASRGDIKTMLCVWGFTLFLPYIKMAAPFIGYGGNYGHMGLLGECDWNMFGTFYYVSGFVGYLVLAYYLRTYPLDWSWRKIAAICIPMFLVGYVVTSVGYIITNEYFPGNYAYLEILWYFNGINVFMMTFPIFVVVQRLDVKPRKWLSQAAKLTFGIYLCHFTFTFFSYDLYDTPSLPYVVRIFLAATTTIVISALVVWVMQRFRVTKVLVS